MQIMPETARVIAKRNGLAGRITADSLRDPFLNLTLGVIYLRELRERYSGLSPYYQLAAYNLGPAKFDSLRSQPGFKPSKTLKYYQDIMKGISTWRFYGRPVEEAAVQSPKARVKAEPRSA
jgi:soluble lytic murein transglycosylase-like protein